MTATASSEPKSKLRQIEVNKIRENPIALRSVNRLTDEFKQLADSIKARGVLNPILVREMKDEDGQTIYGLIDGLQRYSASLEVGRETIDAKVVEMADAEVLEAQIITNVHRIETKPVEYTKQLIKILGGNPLLTIAQLASKLAKSTAWLQQRLGLVKLSDEIGKLVDDGKINLSNAYALAKLPSDEQPNFLSEAMTESPGQFVPRIDGRMTEIRKAKREGRDPNKADFEPVPHVQKIGTIKEELSTKTIANVLIARTNITDPVDAFALGVAWTLHLDPISVDVQREEHIKRKKREAEEREAKKEKARQERADNAAREAAAITA